MSKPFRRRQQLAMMLVVFASVLCFVIKIHSDWNVGEPASPTKRDVRRRANERHGWSRDNGVIYTEFEEDNLEVVDEDADALQELIAEELAAEIKGSRKRTNGAATPPEFLVDSPSGFKFDEITVRLGHRLLLPSNGFALTGTAFMRYWAQRTFSDRARLKNAEDILSSFSPLHLLTKSPSVSDVVIDVGSNSGTFGLHAAIYGFRTWMVEPHPLCAHELQKAVVANKVSGNAFVVQAAVADEDVDASAGTYAIEVGLVCRSEMFLTPFRATRNGLTADETADVVKRRISMVDNGDLGLSRARAGLPVPLSATGTTVGVKSQRNAVSLQEPVDTAAIALTDTRIAYPVKSIRLDTLLRVNNISSVMLLVLDLDGYEPVALSSALASIRAGMIQNIIVRFSTSEWNKFGYAKREEVARFIGDVCVAGRYFAVRLPASFFSDPVGDVIAKELGEGRIVSQDFWFSRSQIDGASRC
eukprot:Opistho-2@29155